MEHSNTARTVRLPTTVVSVIDLGRLQREVEAVENFLNQAAAREAGKSLALPRTTAGLDALCQENKLNLLVKEDRDFLTNYLAELRTSAPKIHISFAADPSAAFIQKIVGWFRDEVDPRTILQIGLQPKIAAGCIVRTENKYIDMSLGRDFSKNRDKLMEVLRGPRTPLSAAAPTPIPASPLKTVTVAQAPVAPGV